MAANYPATIWDGNPKAQGALPEGGVTTWNARDANESADETVAVETDLKGATDQHGAPDHSTAHAQIIARLDALEGAPGGGGPDIFIMKSVDESVSNSEVLQDDDELFFAVAPGEIWVAQFMVYFLEAIDSIKYGIGIDAGVPAVGRWHSFQSGVSAFDFGDFLNQPGQGAQILALPIIAILDNTGGLAANVRFRWAQDIGEAAPTIVKKGSTLLAWKQ